MTTVSDYFYSAGGVLTFGVGGAPFFTGNWWFVNPLTGSDGNTGTAGSPFATIYQAYNRAAADNNDVIVLVGSGDTTGTARLSTALAQTIVPTATTGTVTWAKNALHLIGMTAPTGINSRARFAPPTSTYTAATFGNSGNFFNVTASGCYFANFSLFNGFTTGSSSNQIAWIENGGRNFYDAVDFGGMGDAASAGSTTASSLLVEGTGENTFVNCNFGLDTVQRTAANYTVTFGSGTPRNTFRKCRFIADLGSGATAGSHVSAPASSLDRWQEMTDCIFISTVASGGSAMAQCFNIVATGGLILLANPASAGVTAWETSASGYLYVTGAVPTFATSGKGVT